MCGATGALQRLVIHDLRCHLCELVDPHTQVGDAVRCLHMLPRCLHVDVETDSLVAWLCLRVWVACVLLYHLWPSCLPIVTRPILIVTRPIPSCLPIVTPPILAPSLSVRSSIRGTLSFVSWDSGQRAIITCITSVSSSTTDTSSCGGTCYWAPTDPRSILTPSTRTSNHHESLTILQQAPLTIQPPQLPPWPSAKSRLNNKTHVLPYSTSIPPHARTHTHLAHHIIHHLLLRLA